MKKIFWVSILSQQSILQKNNAKKKSLLQLTEELHRMNIARMLDSWQHRLVSNILVLVKIENTEIDWDFYEE